MKQPVKKLEIKEGSSGAFFVKLGEETLGGFHTKENATLFLNAYKQINFNNEIYLAWVKYKEYLINKYPPLEGQSFEFTCEHHKQIDKLINASNEK